LEVFIARDENYTLLSADFAHQIGIGIAAEGARKRTKTPTQLLSR
jgi:hypothetical protein